MAKESSHAPLTRMNRRQMLGTTTALLGGVVAGVAGDTFGQEKPKPPGAGGSAGDRSQPESPGGQDSRAESSAASGKGRRPPSSAFVTRKPNDSAPPKPVQPWDGRQERPGLGPRLPESGADHGQLRRARVPASLLDRERALPVPERLDAEPHARSEEARHGLDARRRVHERLLDGVVRVRRPHASASSATSWSSASITG